MIDQYLTRLAVSQCKSQVEKAGQVRRCRRLARWPETRCWQHRDLADAQAEGRVEQIDYQPEADQ